MGRAARANGGWRQRAPWQGIAHPHAGPYGIMAVLVNGVPEGVRQTSIDLAVGPAGYQQEAIRLQVTGDGTALLPEPLNLRDAVPLWFRASRPEVNVGVRTADLVVRSGPFGRQP